MAWARPPILEPIANKINHFNSNSKNKCLWKKKNTDPQHCEAGFGIWHTMHSWFTHRKKQHTTEDKQTIAENAKQGKHNNVMEAFTKALGEEAQNSIHECYVLGLASDTRSLVTCG